MDSFFGVYFCEYEGHFLQGAYKSKEEAEKAISEYTEKYNKYKSYRANITELWQKFSDYLISEDEFHNARDKVVKEGKDIFGDNFSALNPEDFVIKEVFFGKPLL